MMTEGDIRYIKQHTEKSLKELNMKTTKTKVNKGIGKHYSNPIVTKLLSLKYRINDWYKEYGEDTRDDKRYVMNLISDVRKHNFTKLAPEDVHCCNGLWKRYDINNIK